jgi:hypothetical protein
MREKEKIWKAPEYTQSLDKRQWNILVVIVVQDLSKIMSELHLMSV